MFENNNFYQADGPFPGSVQIGSFPDVKIILSCTKQHIRDDAPLSEARYSIFQGQSTPFQRREASTIWHYFTS